MKGNESVPWGPERGQTRAIWGLSVSDGAGHRDWLCLRVPNRSAGGPLLDPTPTDEDTNLSTFGLTGR